MDALRHRRGLVIGLAVALVVALALVLIWRTGQNRYVPTVSPSPRPATPVGVQLFQWNWKAIAAECPAIAKAGYAFVQTSPPQESITGDPWWIVYQPVSYRLESSLGTRAEFAAMVQTCHAAKVEVYADAVINHMTGQDSPGVGTGGSPYSHYDYPGLYATNDFHHCGIAENDDIGDYSNAAQVQTCELVNLADLNTSSPTVRTKIAAYLNDLQSLGVDGFRVDAAKHISATDLAAIIDLLPKRPKLILEVIRGGADEPVTPEQYATIGQVQEFGFARQVSDIVRSGSWASLATFSTKPFLPSSKAVSFIDNHDTERNGETLSLAEEADKYRLAEVVLLGYGYGTPVVLSGYTVTVDHDGGPPRAADGSVQAARCLPETPPWTCNHRDPVVVGMMAFHRAVGAAPVSVQVSGDVVGIARGGHGFVAINGETFDAKASWVTNLAPGEYCNLVVPNCAAKVTVGPDGVLSATVPAGKVIAIVPDSTG